MKTKHIYLLLIIIGIILPYSQLIPWILNNGFDVSLLFQQIAHSRIAAFGWLDALVSAVVLIVMILSERRTKKVRLFWLPIVGIFAVGVSLGFPLYLYLKEISK